MSKRPYPEGVAWDEAWRQRQRADEAEAKIESFRERVIALEDALEMLVDLQNGPPLKAPRQSRQWHAAMAEACRLLGREQVNHDN